MIPIVIYTIGTSLGAFFVALDRRGRDDIDRVYIEDERNHPRTSTTQSQKVLALALQDTHKTTDTLQEIQQERQQQTNTIAKETVALHQRVTQLKSTTSALNTASQQIDDQGKILQNHVDEITRLRSELTQTNEALQNNQTELADKQVELNTLITQFKTTQTDLAMQTMQNQTMQKTLVNSVSETHQTLESSTAAILQQKNNQIRQLEQDVARYRQALREINRTLNGETEPQHNAAKVSSRQLSSLGVFSHSAEFNQITPNTPSQTFRKEQA